MSCFQPRRFNSELFRISVFDILQIPSGCIAPYSSPLAADVFYMSFFHFNIIFPSPPFFYVSYPKRFTAVSIGIYNFCNPMYIRSLRQPTFFLTTFTKIALYVINTERHYKG